MGTTVIMDKTHYKEMVETIMNDNDYNEKLASDPYSQPGIICTMLRNLF